MRPFLRKYSAHTISSSRWSWSHKGSTTAINIDEIPNSPTREDKKLVIAKNASPIILWHFWTLIPCVTTAVLLSLNLSKYVIGTEIGRTQQGTENILSVLQMAAKVHEITIMVGLVNITQQWIQGCLIGGGTLLGLLGAEQSLGNLSFIISKEFTAAISYGINGLARRGNRHIRKERRRRKNVLFLAGFMFVACLLCAVVGPASAVLMIPQLNWFFESYCDYNVTSTELKSDTGVTRYPVCYPYILIDPRLGGGEYPANPFDSAPPPQYWSHAWFLKVVKDTFHTDETHQFSEDGVPTTVNTTTTWDRPLVVGQHWKGGTNFSGVNLWDVITTSTLLEDYQPVTKNTGSKAQFVANLTGIQGNTVCRRRRKQSCDTGANGNSSEWCYSAVSEDTDEGELQSSRNLLYVVDHMPDPDMTIARPRFWMTEGGRITTSPKFTDSIVFVFEEALQPGTSEELLTVCAISATLKSVTVVSTDQRFSAEQAQFHDYLAYFNGVSTKYVSSHTLLYHENWLDQIHEDVPVVLNDSSPIQTPNVTYPPRNSLGPTDNTYLKAWATELLNSNTNTGAPVWEPVPSGGIEAGILETVIGGAYITILLRMQASDSQYSTSYIPRVFIRSGKVETYPADLIPEAMLNYTSYKYPPLKVYRLVYGYRSLSVVGIASASVLVIHSLIALLGSLWQCHKGGVIRAWKTVPQYGALCLGTDPAVGGIENTCAGIEARETLMTFVRIGETRGDHLELAVVSAAAFMPRQVGRIDLSKRYGFLGARGRRKMKME